MEIDKDEFNKKLKNFYESKNRYRQKVIEKKREKLNKLKEENQLENEIFTEKKKYKMKKFSVKMEELHKKDEIFYKRIWDTRPHICCNCGKFLGNDFYSNDGKILNIFRYAHIIPKSIYRNLRHCDINLMLLCFNCHDRFDHTPRNIYSQMHCYNEDYIDKLKEINKYLKNNNIDIFK